MASSSSSSMTSSLLLVVFAFTVFFCFVTPARSSDVQALLTLKSSVDPSNSIPWRGTDLCNWQGVRECMNGRVSKLVLEFLNLTGSLDDKSLNQLDQLRVLSFKSNSLSGLLNLKSVYLNDNNFSGNRLSGRIPRSLLHLSRLYTLIVQDYLSIGSIPPLNQTSLRHFNLSNNPLSGQIPPTQALIEAVRRVLVYGYQI